MDKLCGIYARISDPKDAKIQGNSVETQISRLKQSIEFKNGDPSGKHKWKLVDIYADEGKSGKNIERAELQRLLSDIKIGRINTVLCVKLDRITRSLLDFYNNLNVIFKEFNVDFISLTENFDTSTPMGKAMLSMTLVWAELEREQTSQRTKVKMLWLAEQGKWGGGHVLGYDLVGKKLVINKAEAKLVNLIFNKYLEKGSVLKVVEFLNEHGYRTKEYISKKKNVKKGGCAFYNQNVLHILTNHLYLGQINHLKKIYPGKHDPIVPKKLWHEVNRRIELQAPKRTNPKREVKHVFLLQGLLKCGWCGNYMSTKYSSGRNRLCYYYQCTRNANSGKSGCKMRYAPAAQLEKVVLSELRKMSTDKQRIQEIVDEANKDTGSVLARLKKDRKLQEVKHTGIKGKIKNIMHTISSHTDLKNSKSVKEELRDLEIQQDQIEKDIQNIDFEIEKVQQQTMNARIMYESLTKFNQIYETADPGEIKELLPFFVEKVSWTPSEIEIALFEQEAQKGQFPPTVNQSNAGALEVKKWLRSYQIKRTISVARVRIPVFLQRVRQQLVIMHGQPPYGIKTDERITRKIILEAKPKVRKPSPIEQALTYAGVLNEPSVVSKSQVAQRFGVSRARVSQVLNLLDLDDTILNELMAIRDVEEHNFFTEHRLRRLAVMDGGEQIAAFNRLREESRRGMRLIQAS